MILDYNYNKNQSKLNISYITKSGGKSLLEFNVSRFKTYFKTPNGRFENWDGSRCDEKYTSDPSKFDIHTYLEELEPKYKELLQDKYFPKLYCFDIETEMTDHFAEPSTAENAITVISVSSPDLNTIVLGTRAMDEAELEYCQKSFQSYMEGTQYFKELNMPMPYFKYVHFDTEEKMLDYFIRNIVAKVPVLSGWNCLRYDWQYISNRIKNFYPDIALKNSSVIKQLKKKKLTDMSGEHIDLTVPMHTVIVDMMDIVSEFDKTVLPIKESMSLDWIANASIGVKKIEYVGTLQDLYDTDYKRYVYYNTIDSVLVQLINYRFRCLDILYLQGLYCNEKVEDCFSKIALTEALVFNDFYANGIKVVYEDKGERYRSSLMGAYVREPKAGIYEFACCNDFASLYPSTIITCNLSFENYIGQYVLNDKLRPYAENAKDYVVIGPHVHKNDGSAEAPKAGDLVCSFLDEEKLKPYREDPKYFVSVNGCVYRNEKDYAFRRIQSKLKADRNVSKYLGKEMDATIASDITDMLNGSCEYREYSSNVVEELRSLKLSIKTTDDLKSYSREQLEQLLHELKIDIGFHDARQLAMKRLGNSMYGGSSHVKFYWFNMNLANDITGEARNLIHMMERHLGEFWKTAWQTEPKLLEIQKKRGLKLKSEEEIKNIISASPQQSLCTLIYGDSVDGKSVVKLRNAWGYIKSMTIKELYDLCADINGIAGIDDQGSTHVLCPYQMLNYKDGTIQYCEVKDLIAHKVTKEKWRLTTVSGHTIDTTADHSLVIFSDGRKMIVKPREVVVGDSVMILSENGREYSEIESCECIGYFEDEYVYDVEMADETHTFFANDILVHNTDSLYISYKSLLDTIVGVENMTMEQKRDIILDLNLNFLDQHNCDYIAEYYTGRHVKSVHKFELETVALRGAWLNVKKRYAQVLMWKDGKFYHSNDLPMKIKGLEIIQSKTPKKAREILLGMMRYILEEQDRSYFIHKINKKLMMYRAEFMQAPFEDICGSLKVNNYNKYILDDHDMWPKVTLKCPSNVRAVAQYNCFRNKLTKDPNGIYGGKLKWYFFRRPEMKEHSRVAFQAQNLPDWLPKVAPIDKNKQFEEIVLNPLNRIITAMGMPELKPDGSVQMSLF